VGGSMRQVMHVSILHVVDGHVRDPCCSCANGYASERSLDLGSNSPLGGPAVARTSSASAWCCMIANWASARWYSH
jgi:hypothetical protein